MTLNGYDTLVEASNDLRKRGFTARYELKGNKLENIETHKTYQPEDLQIVEYHRFEGKSNPADSAIIFALEMIGEEEKGTVIMNYSSEVNMDLFAFMDKVRIKPSVSD
ncbi:MAG: phosphoribosylpyrophosphate synthetase [Bacteroidetes bacterium]|nr:MAG: phosphoribosylpyrophosphate synthetase [Bacteroidota bacterium]